jgi:hypothetical protein
VIYTGPNEPNLRVVRILDTENDDREMHFTRPALRLIQGGKN